MYSIRPLRLSNFRTHLEMLEEEDAGNGVFPPTPPRMPSDGLWRSSDQVQYAFDHIAAGGAYVPPDRLSALYGEVPPADRESGPRAGSARPRREPPKSHFEPPRRQPCDRASIAAELRLHPGLSRADLHRIRRDFARANHPDRVPPSCREEANQRMTLANALIDGALKEGEGAAADRRT